MFIIGSQNNSRNLSKSPWCDLMTSYYEDTLPQVLQEGCKVGAGNVLGLKALIYLPHLLLLLSFFCSHSLYFSHFVTDEVFIDRV